MPAVKLAGPVLLPKLLTTTLAVNATAVTRWVLLTVYVPVPPVPPTNAVIRVPAVIPVPNIVDPTFNLPRVTEITFSTAKIMSRQEWSLTQPGRNNNG